MAQGFGLPMQAPTVHTLVHSLPDGVLLVAHSDGQVVGTGGAIGFGRTAWIGGVAVAPEFRGAGLGRRLTEAALDWLGPRETVLLLATELGRPIYDRLGFVAEGRYRVFRASASGAGEFPAGDPFAVDRSVTGEDRSVVLAACPAVACGGAVALRPPWPALPILGSPDGAEVLLRALVRPRMRLALPEENELGVGVLLGLGEERDAVVRMRVGPPVAWRPREV